MSKIIGITAATPAKPGTGGGTEQIQSDYEQNNALKRDYIKNRPFYELPAPADIAWDGDIQPYVDTGKIIVSDGIWSVKVSDQTPEPDKFIGGTVTYVTGDITSSQTKSQTITESDILDMREHGKEYAIISDKFIVYYDDIEDEGFDGTGIYFHWATDGHNYTQGFTFVGAEAFIKKIDKKFLPDDIGVSVTEVFSPEEITADSHDGFYVVPGGEGGGGSTGGDGAKVIDLSAYTYDAGSTRYNLAELILFAFSNGGGKTNMANLFPKFWEDINTDKPLKLILDASAVISGAVIECTPVTIVREDGVVTAIQTASMFLMGGNVIKSEMLFQLVTRSNEMILIVIKEQPTIPNS